MNLKQKAKKLGVLLLNRDGSPKTPRQLEYHIKLRLRSRQKPCGGPLVAVRKFVAHEGKPCRGKDETRTKSFCVSNLDPPAWAEGLPATFYRMKKVNEKDRILLACKKP